MNHVPLMHKALDSTHDTAAKKGGRGRGGKDGGREREGEEEKEEGIKVKDLLKTSSNGRHGGSLRQVLKPMCMAASLHSLYMVL